MEEKVVSLVVVGESGTGKSAIVNALADNPINLLPMYSRMSDRSKPTISYKFIDRNNLDNPRVSSIQWNINNFVNMKIEDYNNKCLDNPFKVIGLKPIEFSNKDELDTRETRETFRRMVMNQLNSIEKSITIEKVIAVSKTVEADKYINRIDIEIPANEHLSYCLHINGMKYFELRDTKGFMDEEIGEDNCVNIKSISDLGFDNIHGVIFICDNFYTNLLKGIYRDRLKAILDSVPVFLVINKDESIENNIVNSEEKANEVINKCRLKHDRYARKFYKTFELFKDLDIVNEDFEFTTFNYFKNEDIEYLLPMCEYLDKVYCGQSSNTDNPIDDETYKSFTHYVGYTMTDIIDKLISYYQDIYSIFYDKTIITELRKYNGKFVSDLVSDLNLYGDIKAKYAHPVARTGESINDILDDICNSNIPTLGVYGGITTKQHSKWKFLSTVVTAVASYQALHELIYDNICYDDIASKLHGTDKNRAKLIRKGLLYLLYQRLADKDACPAHYYCLDRYAIAKIIERIRNLNIPKDSVTKYLACNVYDKFCKEVSNVSGEPLLNLFINTNKENL